MFLKPNGHRDRCMFSKAFILNIGAIDVFRAEIYDNLFEDGIKPEIMNLFMIHFI